MRETFWHRKTGKAVENECKPFEHILKLHKNLRNPRKGCETKGKLNGNKENLENCENLSKAGDNLSVMV